MKTYLILLIAALLLVFSCRKEKSTSNSGVSSITLTSPINNAVTSLRPTFKWGANNLTGPYTLYLYYFNLQQNAAAVDSIHTDSLSYTWTYSLNYGASFKWAVRSGTVMSATDSFTTIYPDSQLVGRYWVSVDSESSSVPNNNWDTVYGHCMLTVSIGAPGTLNLYSDSFATFPFSITYNNYAGGSGQYFYGDYTFDQTVFSVSSDSITISAFYGWAHISGSNGITWTGRKVH